MCGVLDVGPAVEMCLRLLSLAFSLRTAPLPLCRLSTPPSPMIRVVAKPLCRSACLRFSAACSDFISNDPVLAQLLGSSIDCGITTAADLNTLEGGVAGAGWVYDGYSILKTGSEDLFMKEYDFLGGYRCSAMDAPLVGNPFFPESAADFFLGGLPYQVECFDPFVASGGDCGGSQILECPDPYLVSDRSGCDTCKMPCPSFIYETREYRTMWVVRCQTLHFLFPFFPPASFPCNI
jgi:hypothetical protein